MLPASALLHVLPEDTRGRCGLVVSLARGSRTRLAIQPTAKSIGVGGGSCPALRPPPPHSSARALGVVGERGLKIALGGGEAAIRGRDARLAACAAGRGLGRRSTARSQDAPPQAPARRPPHFLGAGHLTHSRCHGDGGVAAALPYRTPRPTHWARPAGRRLLPRPQLMTGREAVMSVWARVGRGRDERRVEGERPRGRVITAPFRPTRRGPGRCTWRPLGGGAEVGRSGQKLQPASLAQIPAAQSQGGRNGDWMYVYVARCGAHVCLWARDPWVQRWRNRI